jgi:hypothetical protein
LAVLEQGFDLVRNNRLGFFGGLAAEGTSFMDLGGQFLHPRHHPPLLRQRRQRNFITEYMRRSNRGVIRRALRGDLLAKRWRADKKIQKAPVELRLINHEQEIVAAHD